jgi:hypothetical protein
MKKSLTRANLRSGWVSEWFYFCLALSLWTTPFAGCVFFQIAVLTIVREQRLVKAEKKGFA